MAILRKRKIKGQVYLLMYQFEFKSDAEKYISDMEKFGHSFKMFKNKKPEDFMNFSVYVLKK